MSSQLVSTHLMQTNIERIFVTLDVSHAEMSWLKDSVPKNLPRERVEFSMSSRLVSAPLMYQRQGTYINLILVTLDVSHALSD